MSSITPKDMAEFFRLGLLSGLCSPAAVISWADDIVAADSAPHLAFIELCVADALPVARLLTLLKDVPGEPTPGVNIQMLLGHAWRLTFQNAFLPEDLSNRIAQVVDELTCKDTFDLRKWHEDFYMAHAGLASTPGEIASEFIAYLAQFAPYAPTLHGEAATRTPLQ